MDSISTELGALLVFVAGYIRTTGEHSCPLSALKRSRNLRAMLRDLVGMRLVMVDGDFVRLTLYGWAWVCATAPEILKRSNGKKK